MAPNANTQHIKCSTVACFQKTTAAYVINQEAQIAVLKASSVKVHIFSEAQNSSQVHHNTSSAAHFRGLLCPDRVFLHDFAGGCCCAPRTYYVKWTITFWLSSLIPRDHAPIVYLIPLLWVLCISEIAKIVDPGLWNSTSVIWAVAWITSSSSACKTCSVLLRDKETRQWRMLFIEWPPVGLTLTFPLGDFFAQTQPTVMCQ